MKSVSSSIGAKDVERLAADVYRLLKEQGFDKQQFIQFSSELLGQVIESLQVNGEDVPTLV